MISIMQAAFEPLVGCGTAGERGPTTKSLIRGAVMLKGKPL